MHFGCEVCVCTWWWSYTFLCVSTATEKCTEAMRNAAYFYSCNARADFYSFFMRFFFRASILLLCSALSHVSHFPSAFCACATRIRECAHCCPPGRNGAGGQPASGARRGGPNNAVVNSTISYIVKNCVIAERGQKQHDDTWTCGRRPAVGDMEWNASPFAHSMCECVSSERARVCLQLSDARELAHVRWCCQHATHLANASKKRAAPLVWTA